MHMHRHNDPRKKQPPTVAHRCVRMFKRQLNLAADPDRLLTWRTDRLRHAGCSAGLADRLARDAGYDLHALLELIDRGCPAGLAARILAPLENDGEPC